MGESSVGFTVHVSTDTTARQEWQEFCKAFSTNRYFIDNELNFIKHYLSTIENDDKHILQKGEIYYRARINSKDEYFKDKELNMPPAEIANFGRLNPKGIPYLYIAEEIETAIAEVRPYISAKVDIATCEILSNIEVLDLTKNDKSTKVHDFRRLLSEEFSKPVDSYRSELAYLPTQYVAEYMETKGFKGIKYKSAVNSNGYNVCLFSNEEVKVTFSERIVIDTVTYSHSPFIP